MTDPELVEKKLAFIETCLADLARLARADEIRTDILGVVEDILANHLDDLRAFVREVRGRLRA